MHAVPCRPQTDTRIHQQDGLLLLAATAQSLRAPQLEGVLTQITQATNFRQKQRLVDLYHHAALLLPEVERNHTFPTVAGGSDARHGQQVTA